MSEKKFLLEFSISEINTIRNALDYLQEKQDDNQQISLDDDLEPYYYNNEGELINDDSDQLIRLYHDIDSIYTKTWKVVRLNSS